MVRFLATVNATYRSTIPTTNIDSHGENAAFRSAYGTTESKTYFSTVDATIHTAHVATFLPTK